MSDYFGALLRASGLAGRPITGAPARLEVDAEWPALGTAAAAEAAAGTRRAAPAADSSSAAEPRRSPAPESASGAVAAVVRTDPGSVSRSPAAHVDAEAARAGSAAQDAAHLPPPAPVELPAPASVASHPAVQAALRWVAADPQAQPPGREAARQVSPMTAGRLPAAELAAASTSATADPPARGAFASPPRVIASARALPIDRPAPRPADDEPAVEVSIGSIHLRVDGPATPQTTTRSAAPVAPVAPPAVLRSGLARRALRRL